MSLKFQVSIRNSKYTNFVSYRKFKNVSELETFRRFNVTNCCEFAKLNFFERLNNFCSSIAHWIICLAVWTFYALRNLHLFDKNGFCILNIPETLITNGFCILNIPETLITNGKALHFTWTSKRQKWVRLLKYVH